MRTSSIYEQHRTKAGMAGVQQTYKAEEGRAGMHAARAPVHLKK